MADETLIKKIQGLSDLELAVLVCLVAHENCLIFTETICLDDVARELELITSKVFGLSPTVINCSQNITLDEFSNLTLEPENTVTTSKIQTPDNQGKFLDNLTSPKSNPESLGLETRNATRFHLKVIITKNFDFASWQVQNRALELMRDALIISRTSSHHVSKKFFFIGVISGGIGPKLMKHLNDYMFISHFHHSRVGFVNLEERITDEDSISSVIKRSHPRRKSNEQNPSIFVSAQEIEQLIDLSQSVTISVEVKRYQMNIISFLRIHRAVASGVTASATKLFDKLARCLALIHDLTYVTPSLIALAARKIYLHRIQIAKPEDEKSVQWGSDIEAIAVILDRLRVEDILDEVLGNSGAETPL